MSTPGRTPLQMKESLTNVLNWLLFLKIFLLVTSISFISVALFGRQERQHIASREREFLLTSGLYVGSVSLLAGVANFMALLALKLWRRVLMVPYLACLVFGAMYSLCYILEAIFITAIEDVVLIAAILGFLSCCVLLSNIFPVFLVMALPCPSSLPTGSNSSASSSLASANLSDNPPGYDTLMNSQLPSYDDSIVQKTNLPAQVGVVSLEQKEKAVTASQSSTMEA